MTLSCQWIAATAGSPEYTAQQLRNGIASLVTPAGDARPLGGLSGRVPGRGMIITLSGSTIQISAGVVFADVQVAVATGTYIVSSDAQDTSLSWTAADPTNARKDGVYVRVNDDPVDSSGSRTPEFVYVEGVADGSLTVPDTPARCVRLGVLNVPASGGGSPTVSMDEVYSVAVGGVLPCLSTARPSSPYAGQAIFETDTKLVQVYDGAGWVAVKPGPLGVVAHATCTAHDVVSGDGVVTSATVTVTLTSGRLYEITYAMDSTIVSFAAQVITKVLRDGAESGIQRIHTATSTEAAGTQTGLSRTTTEVGDGSSHTFAITCQVASGSGANRVLARDGVTVKDLGVAP